MISLLNALLTAILCIIHIQIMFVDVIHLSVSSLLKYNKEMFKKKQRLANVMETYLSVCASLADRGFGRGGCGVAKLNGRRGRGLTGEPVPEC